MSTIITVTSATELKQALSQATGGETILLAAGDYGRLDISAQYASNVTIKSADATSPASFSELRVKNAANITFEDVKFDYTFSGQAQSYRPFQINGSSNITIKESVFDGDVASGVSASADGFGTGYGLYVRNSSGVTVENNEYFNWLNALHVGASSNVAIKGNNIHSIRADGMYLDGNQGITVEGNYLHDFNRSLNSGDHGDFIQFSKLLGPSSDITIRGNVIDMAGGDYAQAIFMGSGHSDPSDPSMFYQNLLIEDNMIYNGHIHGIAVSGANNVTVSNNTVLAVPGLLTGGVSVPQINVSSVSTNVTINQNVTSGVVGHTGQADWSVSNNVFAQNTNPNGANYYDNLFTYHATGAQDGYNQFGVKSGSVIETLGAGSSIEQQFPMSYDSWVGTSTTGSTDNGGGTTTPDSGTTPPDSDSTNPDTDAPAPDSGSTPPDADTTPPDGGTTEPDNDPTAPDGGTTNPDSSGGDSDDNATAPDVISPVPDERPSSGMVFDDFVLEIANLPGNDQARLVGDAHVADTGSGPAIQFDGKDDFVKMGRLKEFEGSDQIAFTVEYARNEADGSMQRLVWNHTKIGLTLDDDGLIAHVANNDASFHKGFRAYDLGLNDTDTHVITLMVDETADRLQVLVDGAVVIDETSVDFDFSGGRERGWTLGTAWGRDVDGEVSAFAIDNEVEFVDNPVVVETWVQDDLQIV
ncbi:right-handed parallel beta-helix repeat-containing protein [Ruegeria sp.]|uniref:right-handed parallel beta-helix repeat-containing protein n=1 Tax=Ruegeria sp. TaxID=1879320 RepID=UPI003C7DB18E